MPIDPHDPRLTAYALDELPTAERDAFASLLRADPSAQAVVDEIRRTAAALSAALAAEALPERSIVAPPRAHPRHWLVQLILENWTLWVPLGAAAAFALFFWRVYLPAQRHREETAARALALARRPGGTVPLPLDATELTGPTTATTAAEPGAKPLSPTPSPTGLTTADTASLKTGHFLTAGQYPTSRFPIAVGTASYADIRRCLTAGELPPTGLVRLEELVNAFSYQYPRPAAGEAVALSTELHLAPWAPGHVLVRIGVQAGTPADSAPSGTAATPLAERPLHEARAELAAAAAAEIRALAARDVRVQVDFNPDRVLAYRLLGYENRLLRSEAAEPSLNQDLAAGRAVTALYELIPLPAAPAGSRPNTPAAPPAVDPRDTAEWLTVKLRYNEPALARARTIIVPLHAPPPADLPPASADFKFTAAVAGFGLLLQDDPNKGAASWDLVEQLAAPGTTDDADGRRQEFLSLVRQARTLSTPSPAHP